MRWLLKGSTNTVASHVLADARDAHMQDLGLITGSSVMGGTYLARLIVERLSVTAFQYMLDIVMAVSGIALLWQALR